jgi:hypothetical protein
MKNRLISRPVDVVRTSASDNGVRGRRERSESTLEILPDFEEALEDMQVVTGLRVKGDGRYEPREPRGETFVGSHANMKPVFSRNKVPVFQR